MNLFNLFDLVSALLELALLTTTYRIIMQSTVKSVIRTYRLQSYLVAILTGFTAVIRTNQNLVRQDQSATPGGLIGPFVFFALLPFALGLVIEPFLIRATVFSPPNTSEANSKGNWKKIVELFWPSLDRRLAAERSWLLQKDRRSSLDGFIFVLLLSLVSIIAFWTIPPDIPFDNAKRFGLVVSLTLHLAGLYSTMRKKDIITQVVGLLTMDHGLYLAVVKIVAIPVPANFLVLALLFYTLITVTIVLVIVPQVSHAANGIDLNKITSNSDLKG